MFERARSAIDALEATTRQLDPACLDGRDAVDAFELFAHGERICAAAKALLARRADEAGEWRGGGHRSAAHYIAETTGETIGSATRTLETARALDALPATDEAFRSGELSALQAAEIAAAATEDPCAETELLATAHEMSVKGSARQVPAGARRRRGRRSGVGAPAAHASALPRLDQP